MRKTKLNKHETKKVFAMLNQAYYKALNYRQIHREPKVEKAFEDMRLTIHKIQAYIDLHDV